MKFKPKRKEKWRKDKTIKIMTLLDIIENPKGHFTNKEKLINIRIETGLGAISTSFPSTKKGKKEAIKFIKEESYL